MSFWQKTKQVFRSLLSDRYGMDPLNRMLLWFGFSLYLLGAVLGLNLLSSLGLAGYVLSLIRMLSRNHGKRQAENRRYMAWKERRETRWKQSKTRFRNRKIFTYFKCPGCRAWLKLPKGAGVVTVTCGRCQNNFTQKG